MVFNHPGNVQLLDRELVALVFNQSGRYTRQEVTLAQGYALTRRRHLLFLFPPAVRSLLGLGQLLLQPNNLVIISYPLGVLHAV